jgi:CDP-diacylglycerol--serine O-phosphatidyltransferase
MAPAALIYKIALNDLGMLGLAVTFVPVLFAAIRLARFNLSADGQAHDYVGLSSPLHACLIASFTVMSYSRWGEIVDSNVLAAVVIVSSLLMVSHLPMPGLPRFTLRLPGYNLAKMLFLLVAVGFMIVNPARNAFPALTVLIVSALIVGAIHAAIGRREDDESDEDLTDEEPEREHAWSFRGRR